MQEFSAQSTEGTFNSTDTLGKYLVLYFYPKDNTPGCTNESKDFRDLYADFQKLNTEIVGISRDTLASHNKFKEKHQLPFTLISDTDSKVCDLFKVIKEKSMFGRTALGLVRSTFLFDPKGKLLQEWRKVKVAGHAEEVLRTVRDMSAK